MKKCLLVISIIIYFFLLFPGKENLVLAGCNCGACDCTTFTNPWGGCGGSCSSTGGCGAVGCLLSPCNECGGGGSFTADTKIAMPDGDPSAGSGQGKEIQNVKEGDIVKSFNPETGEIKEATVTDVHKRQVSGYYILKTESGREIKVTGEHPVLALKQGNGQFSSTNFQSIFNFQIINDFFEGVWEKIRSLL